MSKSGARRRRSSWCRPRSHVRTAIVAGLAAVCLAALAPGAAHGQATYFFRGPTATWSTGTSWWTTYSGPTSPAFGPGGSETAVFNANGGSSASTVVLTDTASINRLLTLPTATGGLLLRSDGTPRTLTLGPGGIRVQSGTLALGSASAGQGLNLVLAGSQDWRLGGQALTINGTVSGTSAAGGSQTLFIDRANGLAGSPVFTNGTAGGGLNVWFNDGTSGFNVTSLALATSSTVGSLSLQNVAGGRLFIAAGSYPGIGELRMAGYGFGVNSSVVSLNPSGTVRFLGGSSYAGFGSTVSNAGALVRQPGGGIYAFDASGPFTGITSATLADGILPWVVVPQGGNDFATLSGSSLAPFDGSLQSTLNSLPTSGTTGNYRTNTSSSYALTANRSFNGWRTFNAGYAVDLSNFFLTMTGWYPNTNGGTMTLNASGTGALRIGPYGELVIAPGSAGNVVVNAPIQDSAPGGWITYGVPSTNTSGLVAGSLTLSGSNSHSGGTSILTRGINLNNAYALGSGTFRLGGQMIVLDNTSNGAITIATNNLHEWNSDFSFGGTQPLNLGTGTVSLGTWAGSWRTITTNGTAALTVGGPIVNGSYAELPTSGLVKSGSGTLVLAGANTYTAGTEFAGGVLSVSSDANLGASSAPLIFNGGALRISGTSYGSLGTGRSVSALGDQAYSFDVADGANTFTVSQDLAQAGSSGLTKAGAGVLALTGTSTFTGPPLVAGGVVVVDWFAAPGQASPLGSGTTVNLGSGDTVGTLRYTGTGHTVTRVFNVSGTSGGGGIDASGVGALVITSTVTAADGSKTLTLLGTSTAANSIGVIGNPSTGSLAVVKDGVGRWRLTGTSSFDGGFSVKNGTVQVAANAGASGNSGVFGGGSNNTPLVGDTAAGASGVAALLGESGATIRSVRVMEAGVGSTQAVLVGGANTSGTVTYALGADIQLGRSVALVAATGGSVNFENTWLAGSGTPSVDVAIGTTGHAGTVRLKNPLPLSVAALKVDRGTLRLAVDDVVGYSQPVTVGSAGGPATLDLFGSLLSQANLTFTGDGSLLTNTNSGVGGLRLANGGSAATVAASGTGHVILAPVALDDAATFTVASAGRLVVGGTIGDGTSAGQPLVKSGPGELVLAAANTYTGTTNVAAGTLRIGNGGAAGAVNSASVLALSGGQLVLDRSDGFTQTFAGTVLSGVSTVATTAGNTVNLGAITLQSGGMLDVAATAAVVTSSPNSAAGILGGGITFGGTTWAVANGTSPITGLTNYTLTSAAQNAPANYANANIGVDSSPTLSGPIAASSVRFAAASPETLTLAGASTVDAGILVTAGVGGNLSTITGGTLAGSAGDLAVTQNNTAGGLTIASVIADAAAASGLTKAGAGLLTVTAANTYTGPTSIPAGTLQLGDGGTAGSLSASSAITGAAGATLAFNRTNTLTQGTDFGTIGGAINVAQGGTGTTVLAAANTYTGTTSIDAGTLQVGNGGTAGSVASSASITGAAGATLAFNRTNTLTQGTDFGMIGGAINVAQAGTGTTVLVAANTYTGTTSINAGTLQVGNGGTAGSIASSAAITGAAGTALVFNRIDNYGGNFASPIGGGISVAQVGSGTLALSAANTFTGATRVTAGRIVVANAQALQNSTLDMNASDAGAVAFNQSSTLGGLTGSRSLDLGGTTLSVGTNAANTTYSGTLSNGALTKVGSGHLSLTSANNYTGGTVLSGGTLSFVNGGLGATGNVQAGGGVLRWATGNTQDLSARVTLVSGGTAAFDTNGNDVTFASGFGGSTNAAVAKLGAGTLTMSGSNAYTGGTLIAGGKVLAANSAALGTGLVTLAGGQLDIKNGLTLAAPMNVTAATMDLSSYGGVATVDYLVVGGGGGGGKAEPNPFGDGAGGGGAGGYLYTSGFTLEGGIYSVIVGAGGSGATSIATRGSNGADSVFGTITAVGGGGGGSDNTDINGVNKGASGGSGGGAASYATGVPATESATAGGSGTVGQGNAGGGSNTGLSSRGGGGGGGASAAGTTASTNNGGAGGAGTANTISGGTVTYAGGGGGGANGNATAGSATGGGGAGGRNGAAGSNATANTGGGGGGGGSPASGNVSGNGGNGGSGMVIVRYLGSPMATGGSVSSGTGLAAGYTIHTFTTTGTSTFALSGRPGLSTISGVISGTGGILKTGSNTLVLSGSNTFSGVTSVSDGSLLLGNAQALGRSTFAGGAGAVSFGGLTAATFGGLSGASNLALSNTSASAVALTVGGNDTSTTYSGALTGGGSLAKVGTGRLTLTGSAGHTGATTVSAGILEVGAAGRLDATSGLSINGGNFKYNAATAFNRPLTFSQGTISGTGTIATAVTIGAGATLSPGNSPGIQPYTSGHAWAPGGLYEWELNALSGSAGVNWDQIAVTGGLSLSALSSGSTFNLNLVTLTGSNTAGVLDTGYVAGPTLEFSIATFDTLSLPSGFSTAPGTDLTSLFTISLAGWQGTKPQANDVSVKVNSTGTGLNLVVVPEPTAIALAGLGLGLAAWMRRRRKR
jgi:autotransporter-associated beta strand protein